MLQQEEFYLRLPSDSSRHTFGVSNTICCYRTQLPQLIRLHDQWEVAMTEMTVPAEANNLHEDEGFFYVKINGLPKLCEYLTTVHDLNKNYVKRYIPTTTSPCKDLVYMLKIPSGKYDTPQDLVQKMQDVFDDQFKDALAAQITPASKILFDYRKFQHDLTYTQRLKVFFQNTQNKIQVGFPESLLTRLGGVADSMDFDDVIGNRVQYIRKSFDSFNVFKYPIDLNMGMNLLYVYSDIVQHNMVGDQWAPLLRVIPFKTKKEASVLPNGSVQNYFEFQHPQYLPLAKTEFDTVEISIRGDTGNPISFLQGKAVVTLHFRKPAK